MRAHHLSFLATALAVSACATVPPLTTPSGKPEVTITGKTQQEAVDMVAAACATKGLTVENQTSSMVTCGKHSDIMMQVMISGSNGNTEQKYQFAAIKQGDAVKVMLSSAWMESSNALGGVSRYPIDLTSPKLARGLQQQLIDMTGGASAERAQ